MPSNQQRREAERLRLQRQVEQRREREVARRRSTLIISIVATLALLAAVVSIIAVYAGGNSSPSAAGPGTPTRHVPHSPSASNPITPKQEPTATTPSIPAPSACATAKPGAKTVRFHGLTVRDASNLKHAPVISGKGRATPKTLECMDLVTGKGTSATDSSGVTVQYTGVFYKNAKVFDSSWQRGQPTSFTLGPGHVITGFTAGIGGAGKVTPMRTGGRRIMILPAVLAYGSSGTQGIPPNTPLVFVVDLHKVAS